MRLLHLLFLTLLALPAYGQLDMVGYYAIDLTSQQHDDVEWRVFQMRQQGVVLMRQDEKGFGKTRKVECTHLDTALQVRFAQVFTISSSFDKHVIWQDDQAYNLYGIAQEIEYSKKFHFFHFDLANKTGKEYQAEFPFTFEIHHFQVSEQVAYIAGTSNDKWICVSFNLLDKSVKLMPHIFEDREMIKQIHHDSTRHELLFTIADTDYRKRKMYVLPYSTLIGGNKRIELKGRNREVRKRTFMEATAFHPFKDKKDIWTIGAYSYEGQPYWQGLFLTKLVGEEQNLTFFRFQDFAHFFRHFPPKRREKMQRKIESYNLKDKEYAFGRKMFWNPDLIETPNYYILTLVGYNHQQPNNNSAIWQSANMRTAGMMNPHSPYFPNARQLINSPNLAYLYSHVAMVGFDKESGRLVWDNMMKVEDVEQFYPEKFLHTAVMGDSLVTAYIKDEKAYSQLCYKREVPQEPHEQETKFILDGKLVEKIEEAELHTWQGKYFLMTGTFKRMQAVEGLSKYVFYVAKIQYKPKK